MAKNGNGGVKDPGRCNEARAGGAGGGLLAGAAAGGYVGSLAGLVGTAIGVIAGGIIGAIAGFLTADGNASACEPYDGAGSGSEAGRLAGGTLGTLGGAWAGAQIYSRVTSSNALVVIVPGALAGAVSEYYLSSGFTGTRKVS